MAQAHWLCITVFLFSILPEVYLQTTKLSVEAGDCGTRSISNGATFQMTWQGGEIPKGCTFIFNGRNSGFHQTKMCYESKVLQINDCNVQLKIQEGKTNNKITTYSCQQSGGFTYFKNCVDPVDRISLMFGTKDDKPLKPNPGTITVTVSAESSLYVSLIIWLCVAFVLFVAVVVIAVVCLVKWRKRSHESDPMNYKSFS